MRPARPAPLFPLAALLAVLLAAVAAGAAERAATAPAVGGRLAAGERPTVGERLAAALADLDPSAAPSPLLIDRALPLSGLAARDGRPGAPPVTAAQWRQMLDELRRAAAAPPPSWPDPAQARAAAGPARAGGAVPLALLDVGYARLRADAVALGLLARDGERLVPRPGLDERALYETGRVFAAAALVDGTAHGAHVSFVLPSRFLISDAGAGPPRLEFDADDGLGYRPLAPDAPVAVAYAEPGRRTLRLRAARPDGSTLESACLFAVRALDVPPPTEIWPLTATVPYEGAVATGEAFVYLADGHAAVTDPVIVVEGFDIDNAMGWDELYLLLNQENLLEDLRADGRDAVVLNFTESTDYIQRNAFVLTELLGQVQDAVAPDQDLAVIGASMGGLVGRYALAWLENQGTPARVRTFISFDAPQGGANIPLGVQYWLDFFQDQAAEAAYLLGRLDTPAARQMLLYHHASPPGTTGESDPLRASLLADFAAVGGWPQQPRLVAVANGSGARADQGYAAGAQLISYEYASFLVDIVGNVWAVPDAASLRIFRGLIDLIWPLPDESMSVTVLGTRPWDNAPGGYRATLAQMDTTAVTYGDIVALHPNHCFIPTVSALALPTDDPFFDVAGTPGLLALTPFDAVYYPAANQEHVLVTPENEVWLRDEIDRAASGAPDGHGREGPRAPVLLASRPNPFNSGTTLDFTLPAAGRAVLAVHDAAGRRVRALLDAVLPPGAHGVAWRGDDDDGRPVAAGVYLACLRTAEGAATSKLAVVK